MQTKILMILVSVSPWRLFDNHRHLGLICVKTMYRGNYSTYVVRGDVGVYIHGPNAEVHIATVV